MAKLIGCGCSKAYLISSAQLRLLLETVTRLIFIEHFIRLTPQNKILSHFFNERDKTVAKWRTLEVYRIAQQAGRDELFKTYRLRIVAILWNYRMIEWTQAPKDSLDYHQES